MKRLLQSLFSSAGFELRKASSVPFGNDWRQDLRFFPNGRELETIFDVGANLGQTVTSALEAFPSARLYCFEPVPSTFEKLRENTSRFPKVTAVCSALADKEGSISMTAEPLSVSNHIVVGTPGSDSKNGKTVTVKVDTLDTFCDRNDIKKINLLKIDTEGYEMNVLKGAQKMLGQGRIDFIMAECEFFQRPNEPHGCFTEILEFVKPFGFNVVTLYTGGVDNLGWVWGDVLFRRTQGESRGSVSVCPLLRPSRS